MTWPLADEGITRIRRETKLLLDAEEAERIAAVLRAEGPPRECRIVAVYFDTPDAKLGRRASSAPADCVKVRAKAYDPDLDPSAARVVLEVKRERGGITSKDRRWLAPDAVFAEVRRTLAPAFGTLAPSIASSYRRRVFQSAPDWRVTMDDDLEFHCADWSLFAAGARLSCAALPPAFRAERRTVLELKHAPGALPEWLAALGRERGERYSKFVAAIGDADGLGSSRA